MRKAGNLSLRQMYTTRAHAALAHTFARHANLPKSTRPRHHIAALGVLRNHCHNVLTLPRAEELSSEGDVRRRFDNGLHIQGVLQWTPSVNSNRMPLDTNSFAEGQGGAGCPGSRGVRDLGAGCRGLQPRSTVMPLAPFGHEESANANARERCDSAHIRPKNARSGATPSRIRRRFSRCCFSGQRPGHPVHAAVTPITTPRCTTLYTSVGRPLNASPHGRHCHI
jgi:hypothetical protein